MPGLVTGVRLTEGTGATVRWPAAGVVLAGVALRGAERSAVSWLAAIAGVAPTTSAPTVTAIHLPLTPGLLMNEWCSRINVSFMADPTGPGYGRRVPRGRRLLEE